MGIFRAFLPLILFVVAIGLVFWAIMLAFLHNWT